MPKKIKVTKGTGEIEEFSEYKLNQTLHQAGVDKLKREKIISEIFEKSENETSTSEIHKQVLGMLENEDKASAARYNLRKAIMELGPSGFPFEQFVSALLNELGYETKTNQIIKGSCVSHEVDVVASKDGGKFMIECKYHNQRGSRSDVKTVLYVWARFEDIHEKWEQNKEVGEKFHEVWIVTNTKVSTDAEDYAKCRGLKIISWHRPYRHSLKDMIVSTGLWPVTCLANLDDEQKKRLIEQNLVLCRDLLKADSKLLKNLKFKNIKDVIREAEFICKVPGVETEEE